MDKFYDVSNKEKTFPIWRKYLNILCFFTIIAFILSIPIIISCFEYSYVIKRFPKMTFLEYLFLGEKIRIIPNDSN